MSINLVALKSELQNDPTARGYSVPYAAGTDNAVADLVNAIRPGATLGRTLVDGWQFVNQITPTDYVALSQGQRDYLTMVASAGQVQLGAGAVRDALTVLFGAGTTTRANLVALLNRPATRAEELFGDGVRVTAEDVAAARRLP